MLRRVARSAVTAERVEVLEALVRGHDAILRPCIECRGDDAARGDAGHRLQQLLSLSRPLEELLDAKADRWSIDEALVAARDHTFRSVAATRADAVEQLDRARSELCGELAQLAETTERAVRDAASLRAQLDGIRAEVEGVRAEGAEMAAEMSAALEEHGSAVERLRGALSGGRDALLRVLDEEGQRDGGLRVDGPSAEWLLRDAAELRGALPRGEAVVSPRFAVEVPGVGTLPGLRLRFFPNGGAATTADECSLYLLHPADMPWVQYELSVGRTRRGPFDPIFQGTDSFCPLAPELTEVLGAPAVRLSVRFLGAARGGSPPKPRPAALAAPQAGELWASANRWEAP